MPGNIVKIAGAPCMAVTILHLQGCGWRGHCFRGGEATFSERLAGFGVVGAAVIRVGVPGDYFDAKARGDAGLFACGVLLSLSVRQVLAESRP